MAEHQTISTSSPVPLRAGDVFTISGYHMLKRNPDRRWWQFWKPRFIDDLDYLKPFRVTDVASSADA